MPKDKKEIQKEDIIPLDVYTKNRKEFRKGRTEEVGNETMSSVIEESLKAVADEMAEKMYRNVIELYPDSREAEISRQSIKHLGVSPEDVVRSFQVIQ